MQKETNKLQSTKRNLSLYLFLILFGGVLFAGCRSGGDVQAGSSARPEAATATNNEDSAALPKPGERPVILAFGDSLTAGYGLESSKSYPTLLQKRLDERGYNYHVVNAGISGDTTAGGLRRIDQMLNARDVKVMILELGANDMLRGQDLRQTKKNLAQMIEKARKRNIKVILAGMEAPTNYGEEYQRDFHNLYPELAKEYNTVLIPFFLANVAGNPELNQGDYVHPNVKGTEIVVDNVWQALEPMLEK